MQKKSSKTRFWSILVVLNLLTLVYPVSLLLGCDDDTARLFAVVVLMAESMFLFVADAISFVFAYWA